MSTKRPISSQKDQERYDKEINEVVSSLQYFVSNSKKGFVSRALGLAKTWYEPVDELESTKTFSVLWPITGFAKMMKIVFGSVTTVVSAVATAIVHPVHTHKLRINLDKLQDPKVLSTLLSDEKFWEFAENNIEAVKAIALKNATPELKGLLSEILNKNRTTDLKYTFANDQHKDFLHMLFKFSQDEQISRGAKTFPFYQHQVDALSKEDMAAREHALKEVKAFLTSKEFSNCIGDLCKRNSPFLETMAKHNPLKNVLEIYGINTKVFKSIVNGPLKEHPETINSFFEAYMSGRFVQNVLELSRDKPGYKKFLQENIQDLKWPTDKFINDNQWLRYVRDPLRKHLPNLNWADVLSRVTEMPASEVTSLVQTLDTAFSGKLTASQLPGIVYRHGNLLGLGIGQYIRPADSTIYQGNVIKALNSSIDPDIQKRLQVYYNNLPADKKLENANYRLMTNSLDYVNLDKLDFKRAFLNNFTLNGSVISNSNLTGARISLTTISDTKLLNTLFQAASINNTSFHNVDLRGSKFDGATILNCNFSGDIKIDSQALKAATIDVDSLNSLIKACEASKIIIDLSDVSIVGNLSNINVFSPAISGLENSKISNKDMSFTKSEIQDYFETMLLGNLKLKGNMSNYSKLSILWRSNEVIGKYLQNNFKFNDPKELDQPYTAAYKVKKMLQDSCNKDGELDEKILNNHVFANLLAEQICKKIFGENYINNATKQKEAQLVSDFILRNSGSLESGSLKKIFKNSEQGIEVKPEFVGLVDAMVALTASYNSKGIIQRIATLEAVSIQEENLEIPALKLALSSLIRLHEPDLTGLDVSLDDYLQIKEAYKNAAIAMDEKVAERYKFEQIVRSLGIKDASPENSNKLYQTLTTPSNWLNDYIAGKLTFIEPILSRDGLQEKHKHYKSVKDSPELITSDLQASTHDGKLNIDEFKLRLVANKMSDQVSEKLFGFANNRAADCLLLQDVIFKRLQDLKIIESGQEIKDPYKKVATFINMFDGPDKIKPQFTPLIEQIVDGIKKEYIVYTTVGLVSEGIQLDKDKVIASELIGKDQSIIKTILSSVFSDKGMPAKEMKNTKSFKKDRKVVDKELLSEAAVKISHEIGQDLWGSGVTSNRKNDATRLSNFIQSIFLELPSHAAIGVLNDREKMKAAITPLIRENALCATAMGLLGSMMGYEGGTQLKVGFETDKLKSDILNEIAKQNDKLKINKSVAAHSA